MRKALLVAALFSVAPLFAQTPTPGVHVQYVVTAPSGACLPEPPIDVVISTGVVYTCDNGTWGPAGGGGGGGNIPDTTAVLKGDNAGNAIPAVPGTDFMAAPGSPAAYTSPVFTGTGGAYNNLSMPLSYASSFSQYIEQTVNNSNYTTFGVNNLNNVFYVDGFSGGNFGGIGQAQVAFASTNVSICQNVSYSGNNYIAISPGNGSITPGTNLAYWWQAPTTQATTQMDCALAVASAFAVTRSINTTVVAGGGYYNMNGWIMPGGLYGVNLLGCGIFCSYVTFTGGTAIPMIQRATGGNFASLQIKNMTLDGNHVASSIMDLGAMNQSYIDEMAWVNVAPGSDHFAEFGLSPGDAFQIHVSNITWSGGNEKGNTATVTANVVGGAVTSYTVSNGGSGYPTASANVVYHVLLTGYQAGSSTQPCTVMPSGQTVTISGGAVTAVTPSGSNGSGCSGTIYVQVYTSFPVNYGIVWNASDSTGMANTGYAGDLANVIVKAGNNKFFAWHPSVVPEGIIDNATDTQWYGTEIDAVFDKGFQFLQPFSTTGSSVSGTNGYVAGRVLTGSSMYYFANSTTHTNFSASGALCDGGVPTGWAEFVTQSGPIVNPADYASKAPATMSVTGNDTACGEVMGDWQPIINSNTANIGALTVTSCSGCSGTGTPVVINPTSGAAQTISQASNNPFTVQPNTAAVSGTNQNSPFINASGFYWNGSASAIDNCGFADQANAGTNPLMAIVWQCAGSSGGHNLLFGPTIASTAWTNLNTFAGGFKTQAASYVNGTWAELIGSNIPAAATIAPTNTAPVTHITGTAATVTTITPPTGCSPSSAYGCEIKLISDAGFLMGTGGNIAIAKTTVAGEVYIMVYDPGTSKWYPTD